MADINSTRHAEATERLILFDLSYDPEAGTSRLIVIHPQVAEAEESG